MFSRKLLFTEITKNYILLLCSCRKKKILLQKYFRQFFLSS